MLIAQISDTHLAAAGKKTYGIAPMAENLTRCIAHINALQLQPDVVLVTGDITNDFLPEQAAHAKTLLQQLQSPWFIVPGNHDDRDVLWDVFGGGACPSRHKGFLSYVIDGYPLRLIGLDSLDQGRNGGRLCQMRLDWLADRLAEAPEQPTILFLHHPPLKCGVPETDIDGFAGAREFAEIVQAHPNILRILCGHIHLPTHAAWHGTVVSTAPSMGMQLTLDLTQQQPSRFLLTAPGYLLHHWTPQKTLITHTVHVPDQEETHAFEEIQGVDL